MQYDHFEYLWPPRPDNAIPPALLSVYENMGFVYQYKKNGTCSVIAVSPDKEIISMNRHNENHKLWSPTTNSSAAFKQLPGKGWYVFVAELLHSKVPGIRDTNYIFDILVNDGKYLVGSTFMERYTILKSLWPFVGEDYSHNIVDANTWVAKVFKKGAHRRFDALERPEDEGLVMKKPDAVLQICTRQTSNNDWQVKARRPTKNYGF